MAEQLGQSSGGTDGAPVDDEGTVYEVVINFSGLELNRLRELATPGSCTVEEYIRACVLGPRAPGPVELLAEIIRRRMGPGPRDTGASGR